MKTGKRFACNYGLVLDRKAAIEKEIQELQIKAVQLNRTGKKPEALQIMVKIRRLKELLESSDDGVRTLSEISSKLENIPVPRHEGNVAKPKPDKSVQQFLFE